MKPSVNGFRYMFANYHHCLCASLNSFQHKEVSFSSVGYNNWPVDVSADSGDSEGTIEK